jgi:phosphoglycerate dehydrogenase-like enzyme
MLYSCADSLSRPMSSTTILVLSDLYEPQLSILAELRDAAKVVIGNSAEEFRPVASEANVILNWSSSLCVIRDVFRMSPRLKWIHSRSAGLEQTLFPELIASKVILTNGSGVFSPSLGEFVLGAILYFAKDFRRMIRNQMAGLWEPFDVMPISGQTVGIIGYGDIGHAVAARVKAMGMNVLTVKRHVFDTETTDPLVDQMYSSNRRIEMLPRCDYVVVAAPLNDETRGLIGEAEFAAMKSTAVVINVGRGPVIDEAAMINALSKQTIMGAALDVFDQEPLPQAHPFYTLENVLLSPHCADHTPDWLDNAMRFFLAQFERFCSSKPLLNVVDKKLGY